MQIFSKSNLHIHHYGIAVVLVLLSALFSLANSKQASIVTPPVSQNVTVHQVTANMSCQAAADELIYIIDNQSGDLQSVLEDGFVQRAPDNNGKGDILREMTVYLTTEMAGKVFSIFCRGFNFPDLMPADSKIAKLKVAGPLGQPEDLSVETLSNSFLISWTPPPTLDNTNISGYKISIDSKTNHVTNFTSDTEAHFDYSDFSPCDSLDITISGYNGVDGNTTTLTLYVPMKPSSDVSLTVNISEVTTDNDYVKLRLTVDVSKLFCRGQRPSHAHVTALPLNEDTIDLDKFELTLETSNSSDTLMVPTEFFGVKSGKEYVISVEFSNSLGVFDEILLYLCMDSETEKYKGSMTQCKNMIVPSSTTSSVVRSTGSSHISSYQPPRPSHTGQQSFSNAFMTKPSQSLQYFLLLAICPLIFTFL